MVTSNAALTGGGSAINVYLTVQGNVLGPGGWDAAAEALRAALLRRGRSMASIGLA